VACLLKAPDGPLKGCVSFTTQERDNLINGSTGLRAAIQALKRRFVIGLHHNWHDHRFQYDPLFDFSMAGDGDLVEAEGRDFARIPIDACNFAPPCYSLPRNEPFWDILYVARAVAFKGIPEFFGGIRALYDAGHRPRVLFICPLPCPVEIPGIPDLRKHFEQMFSPEERHRITFLSIDWDYPFPLDAQSLAFFYRNSRIFFHPAPEERRCRTAAYAWAGRMPVASTKNVASILPRSLHRAPFLFAFDSSLSMTPALAAALESNGKSDPAWEDVSAEFSAQASAKRMTALLEQLAGQYGWGSLSNAPINPSHLDIRLGRHHGISSGANRVDQSLSQLCHALASLSDGALRSICDSEDPELALRQSCPPEASEETKPPAPADAPITRALKKIGLFRA